MAKGTVGKWLGGAALGAILVASLPASALAATKKERALEARVSQLEALVAAMKQEMDAARAQARTTAEQAAQASATATQANATATQASTKVAALEARPAAPAEGFRTGNTTVKIGGYVKTVATFSRWDDGDVSANSLGRDFYLPSAIPIGGVRESTDNDISAKQTRLWLNLASDVAGHSVKGYVETDFQTTSSSAPSVSGGGSERTTNGYTLALRRAFVQLDGLTVGQDWSTFQNPATLPESTDFVGVTEGTVFVRQPLVRYSHKLNPSLSLIVAAENAETATVTPVPATTTLTEQDDDRMPDFVARLNLTTKLGDFALAGLVRQLSIDNGPNQDRATGWGVSGSGKIQFGPNKRHDLRFMVTYGEGVSRYVGLNFAPDAIVNVDGKLEPPEVFGAFAALRLGITPTLRTNLMASYQDVNYAAITPAMLALTGASLINASAYSFAGNLFWSPVKNVDLGVEYRHGQRKVISGAKGQLDRLEFAAKYNF